MVSEGDAKDDESGRRRSEFGPPVGGFGPPVGGPPHDGGPPTGDFGPPLTDFGRPPQGGEAPTGGFGPPTGDFGPPLRDGGPPTGGFGPPLREGGPPTGGFGPPLREGGPPTGDFGPPLRDGGPPTGGFGPPLRDGGPPTVESVPTWSVPRPPGDHPELGWRPAAEPAGPPTDARYRAPDTTDFPAPVAPPPDRDPDATTRHRNPASAPEPENWWSPTDSGEVPRPPKEPRGAESGLSWADDPIAKRLAPTRAVPETTKSAGKGRGVVVGVAVAAVVLIGLIVAIVAMGRGGGADEASATVSPPSTAAALSCPASRDGRVSVGNGPGDTSSGPSAILGFQHAFYVERSGAGVRRYVAPDAENISSADIIQGAITEQIPAGTTHCLRITEVASDTFDVDLTEHRPDGTTTVYRQTVSTVDRDGRILIFAIRERG
ncbi:MULTISPECIES: hypothetical protein [Nocardia]|uniref:hypothetical protein n=1 Tax=Nocardia TaxID=1817 RepID=UPI001E559FEC|nr:MULTISPECIES: hypothetical protein [Nocardia]